MSLEWFSRMENTIRMSLPEVCEGFEEMDILFDTDTTEQHPSFIFSIEVDDDFYDYDDFCIVNFDPINQEFYSYYYDEEADLYAKVLFGNADDMLSYIHASFHDYLDETDEYLTEEELDDVGLDWEDEDMGAYEELDLSEDEDDPSIDWVTNDKYIHIEDNSPYHTEDHSIYYKLGIDKETGDGVLIRNTITKQNGNESQERMRLFFKNEEASYLLDLVKEYMKKTGTPMD